MSYTIHLESATCSTCGQRGAEPDFCPDPTYNLTPIFDLALTGEPMPNDAVSEAGVVLFGEKTDRPRGLRLLSGRTGRDSIPLLAAALERIHDPQLRPRFVELEPPNKWGDLAGAIVVLRKLRELAEEYPANTWSVV